MRALLVFLAALIWTAPTNAAGIFDVLWMDPAYDSAFYCDACAYFDTSTGQQDAVKLLHNNLFADDAYSRIFDKGGAPFTYGPIQWMRGMPGQMYVRNSRGERVLIRFNLTWNDGVKIYNGGKVDVDFQVRLHGGVNRNVNLVVQRYYFHELSMEYLWSSWAPEYPDEWWSSGGWGTGMTNVYFDNYVTVRGSYTSSGPGYTITIGPDYLSGEDEACCL